MSCFLVMFPGIATSFEKVGNNYFTNKYAKNAYDISSLIILQCLSLTNMIRRVELDFHRKIERKKTHFIVDR